MLYDVYLSNEKIEIIKRVGSKASQILKAGQATVPSMDIIGSLPSTVSNYVQQSTEKIWRNHSQFGFSTSFLLHQI